MSFYCNNANMISRKKTCGKFEGFKVKLYVSLPIAYLSLGGSIQDVVNKLKNEREHKKIKPRFSVQSSLDGV